MVDDLNDCSCSVCNGKQTKALLDTQVAHPLWWKDQYADTSQLRYALCENCGYIFLWPRFSVEEYRDIYANTPGLNRNEIKRAREGMLLARKAFIDAHTQVGNETTILEVGTAYGDFINLFSAKRKIGVEPSNTYIETAQAEGSPVEYFPYVMEQAIENAPELKEVADFAMACHVLEHSLNPMQFVAELVKTVKPGGEVFIEVPSIEGMAETPSPLYQNLYFGHVSQFSVPVINRIGACNGLIPIAIQYAANDNYPVIQVLFKKGESVGDIEARFNTHAKATREALTSGLTLLKDVLSDEGNQKILIWGCGQDLFDVVSMLDSDYTKLFKQKVHLVDRNKEKQQRSFAEVVITDPEEKRNENYDAILIATRSEIINAAIEKDCKEHFPNTPIIFTFIVGDVKSHG